MYNLKEGITLHDMEKLFDHELRQEEREMRSVCDLDLSLNDYLYLRKKVKAALRARNCVEAYEKYKLCVVTALAFSYRYEKEDGAPCDWMGHCIATLPQHKMRYCLDQLSTVFDEYGMYLHGNGNCNLERLCELLSEQVEQMQEAALVNS